MADDRKIHSLDAFDAQGLNALYLWITSWIKPELKAPAGGGGSGGGGRKKILACWAGPMPTSTGNGLVWLVPFDSDGSSFTFTPAYARARIESTSTTGITFTVQKSAGGGAFSPVMVAAPVIAAGAYEGTDPSPVGTFSSGDLLRLSFTSVGSFASTPVYFDVELLGAE